MAVSLVWICVGIACCCAMFFVGSIVLDLSAMIIVIEGDTDDHIQNALMSAIYVSTSLIAAILFHRALPLARKA